MYLHKFTTYNLSTKQMVSQYRLRVKPTEAVRRSHYTLLPLAAGYCRATLQVIFIIQCTDRTIEYINISYETQ